MILIDLEVPLLTSLLRVLVRNPFGKEPCVELSAILDGYKKIREDRLRLIFITF